MTVATPRSWMREARRAMARLPSLRMGRVPDAPALSVRDPWPGDPARGAQLATAQFDRGVDVVYAAAGTTGLGVLDVAKASGRHAIGSANKHFADDGTVLTSTVKHLDFAIFQEFSLAVNGLRDGGWKAGHSTLGLKEGAVDWAKDYNERLVTPDIKNRVDAAKSDIIEGRLAVYDYMASNSCRR